VGWQHGVVTTKKTGYETYPRPAPVVAPEKWEQPVFAREPQLQREPEVAPVTSAAPVVGEREIQS